MFMLMNRGERFSDIFVREGNKLLLLLLIINGKLYNFLIGLLLELTKLKLNITLGMRRWLL